MKFRIKRPHWSGILGNSGQPNYLPEDEPKFSIFSQSITFHRKQLAFRALQKTFDAIVSMRDLQSILFNSVEAIAGVLKRGVKIRLLVEKFEGKKSAPSTMKRLEKTHVFKIRYLPNTSNPLMSIYDNKEAFVCTFRNPALKDCTTLWTNDPCFLSIFREYFEMKWQGALGF